jgi:hypothetical protein
MTSLDGLLVIAGFLLGCLPVVEWMVQRNTQSPAAFKRSPRTATPSPWI